MHACAKRTGIAISVSLILAAGTVNADDSICATPLREALMTVRTGSASGASSSAYSAWQCSFKFSSHGEAISAGLDVGAIVYGVPLQVGGTFDQTKVKQWKEENCSRSAQSESFSNAAYSYLREVAPGAMSAFSQCIATRASTKALECTVTREPAALTVKWRRADGELSTAAPKVTRMMVTNGACSPEIKSGTAIREGGEGTPCTVQPKKDLLVMVQTDRGVCTAVATYTKTVFNVVGTISMQGDRQIVSDVVEFADGARIVTNGRSLTITADEVRLRGSSDIASVDRTVSQRPAGDSGTSGGAVLLAAGRIVGGNILRINLSGQDGAQGFGGSAGTGGVAGRNAKGRGLQGVYGCGGGHPSEPGGQGGPGGAGGAGGPGGNGGTVVVQLKDAEGLSRIDIVGMSGSTIAGKGGAGGLGGSGGPGGPGGSGDSGKQGCGGRPGSPAGANGPAGPSGTRGPDGKPGSITIQQGI